MKFLIVLYGVLSIGMQETEENQIIFGRTKLTLCKLRALYRYNYYTHTRNYMSIFRLIIYDVENNLDIYQSLSRFAFFENNKCNHQVVGKDS